MDNERSVEEVRAVVVIGGRCWALRMVSDSAITRLFWVLFSADYTTISDMGSKCTFRLPSALLDTCCACVSRSTLRPPHCLNGCSTAEWTSLVTGFHKVYCDFTNMEDRDENAADGIATTSDRL